jgi:hypothetical protein
MSCEFFTEVNFQTKTLAMIDQANAILEEYTDQGFTLTLRQLFYQFVARMIIENAGAEYGRLGRAMADGRRAGLVDWVHIEDRTRDLETFPSWDSPANIVREAAQQYRENLWLDQQYRPLIGVIALACERWRVSSMAARGYPSHSELYLAGKRFQDHLDQGFMPIVFDLAGISAKVVARPVEAVPAPQSAAVEKPAPDLSTHAPRGPQVGLNEMAAILFPDLSPENQVIVAVGAFAALAGVETDLALAAPRPKRHQERMPC